MGVKRDHAGQTVVPGPAAPRGRFTTLFEGFRAELDEHYDRKERIVKSSRDVTAHSKRCTQSSRLFFLIFALHRSNAINEEPSPAIQKEVNTRLADIEKSLSLIAGDISGLYRYRYYLPCLEELVEALTFAHYLRTQTLLTPAETRAAVPCGVTLADKDYVYGVFDLFGEMMRFATAKSRAKGVLLAEESPRGRSTLDDIQALGCAFETLPKVPEKAFGQKLDAMRASVRKVEVLGYRLR
ncbi:unnamed protein product [Parascedosporium putredinis]|uniref:Translin n=1 Tax=Parascedosporium putredinis TaxID=1442378 RepID=A0A9P1MER9_9PEZI|nr:unnamed protein product [Parascedosporium putredinis]CAI8003359.1 unnamed protein product [Parascedosporium putredinis]